MSFGASRPTSDLPISITTHRPPGHAVATPDPPTQPPITPDDAWLALLVRR